VLPFVTGTTWVRGGRELGEAQTTRNVLTFVNTTAIAGCQDQRKKAEFWRYAIAVVFTNVRTLRVDDPFPAKIGHMIGFGVEGEGK